MEKDKLNKIANGYEDIHKEWKRLQLCVRENEFEIFKSNAYDRKNVLEIGLGDGIFTAFLSKEFQSVIAVDASSQSIDLTKKALNGSENIEFIESFIEDLKLSTKVDNIVISHILEHVDDPIYALKNIQTMMHKDSVMYISVPNAMSLHRQAAVKMGLLDSADSLNDTDKKLGHLRVYSPQLFKYHVKESGLDIIKFGGSMVKPLTNRQIEECWTEYMIKGFIDLGNDYPEICGDIYIIAKLGTR